ncbi:MAG: hypothetical protein MJ151_01400, partial [Lachnospiraceae bacterium]|nr:hypothetical protein [Lachnospiraceae bacterium]
TKYAKGKGISTIVDKNVWYDGCCSYYLRTPGVDNTRVEVIEPDGAIYEYGELVSSTEVGIRPCIWVKYGDIR